MNIILLFLLGLALFAIAPIVGERVSGIGFKLPQRNGSPRLAQEQTVSVSAIVWFLRIAGGLLILIAFVLERICRIEISY